LLQSDVMFWNMVSREKFTLRVLQVLAVYGLLASGIPVTLVLLAEQDPDKRAVVMMGAGLIVVWCIIGGLTMRRFRDRFVRSALQMKIGWRLRFVLLCIVMAMLEEVVTTSLTNAAPLLGAATDAAKITISANYFEVIRTSVVAFIPWFICWAWLLGRYDFKPLEVFLLIGLTGTFAESTINFSWGNFAGVGMWVYVYGLMVYLPVHTIPRNRPVKPVKWYHCIAAVFLPLVFIIPFAAYAAFWLIKKTVLLLSTLLTKARDAGAA